MTRPRHEWEGPPFVQRSYSTAELAARPWAVGDRVTRKLYSDNGVWQQQGDSCLSRSPLMHGTVVRLYQERVFPTLDNPAERWDDLVEVHWDDGKVRRYFDHGIEREEAGYESK